MRILIPLLSAVAVALLAWFAPIDYTASDSHGSLLTAATFVRTGSFDLSAHTDYVARADFRVRQLDGQTFYYFPFGPSLVAVPFVVAADAFGWSPERPDDDRNLQRILAAFVVGAFFLLAYRILSRGWGSGIALGLALVFTLGTGVASTLALAYWNQGPSTVLVLGALLLLVDGGASPRRAAIAGLLMGIAFACRPVAAIPAAFAPLLIARSVRPHAWVAHRRAFMAYACALTLALMGFVAISWWQYGSVVPPYHAADRAESFVLERITGNLFSPSRGLLVMSPFLVPVAIGGLAAMRVAAARPLLGVSFAWIALHMVMLGGFFHWWGGASFGSRLTVDLIPASVLIALALGRARPSLTPTTVRVVVVATFLLAVPSIAIHVGKGMFSREAYVWNHVLEVDARPDRLWDWDIAQWKAGPAWLARASWRRANIESAVAPVDTARAGDPDVVFAGFLPLESDPAKDLRWHFADFDEASIVWRHGLDARPDSLLVHLNTKQPAHVEVRLNGTTLGTVRHEGWPRRTYAFAVDDAAWRSKVFDRHDPATVAVLSLRRPWPARWTEKPVAGFWRAWFEDSDPPGASGN